ncbi:MAG TPA: hypothetical protein VGJ60_07815 [Chloroflexota bacterium]|jgi:hypothetical protein
MSAAKEQVAFGEAIVADLVRLFPDYPPNCFTSNAANARLGGLLTITMPDAVARRLIDEALRSWKSVVLEP